MIALVALGQGEAIHPLIVVREAKLVGTEGDAEEQDDHFGHAVSNFGDIAAASSGFTVSATDVRNQKTGILLYTLDGRVVVPFQGGWLCLAPPIRRTPALGSGGSMLPAEDCSGRWSIDMSAFAAGVLGGTPEPALREAGTTVHCQLWGRDPGAIAGSSLTDALHYHIVP
jgi:hypothetical protein